MHKMVFGVFKDTDSANSAIVSLKDENIHDNDISVIVQDAIVREKINSPNTTTAGNVAQGATGGAVTGGVLGALLGFVVGTTAITIPVLGPVLVAGPIAAALGLTGAAATTATGAITGAVAGGLVGALVGLGVPEEEAKRYEERIKAGEILVAVSADSEDERAAAERVMAANGADELRYYTTT